MLLCQKGLQHGRYNMQCAHALFGNECSEIGWVLMTTWRGHDQSCSCRERPKELPNGDIEAQRRFLQDPIFLCQLIRLLHPVKPITDTSVAIHSPFRLAR